MLDLDPPDHTRSIDRLRDRIQAEYALPIPSTVIAEEAGDRLNSDEVLAMVFLLLVAGHETTDTSLLAHGAAVEAASSFADWRHYRSSPPHDSCR